MRRVTRRDVLKVAAATAAWPALRGQAAAVTPRRPNVLMIVADDQRPDVIAALGNGHIKTPNYDRVVQRGFALTRARCMVGNHGAVCVPARATLLTGRTVFHTPFNMGQHVILPQVFGRQGYRTFISGKWHNEAAALARGFKDGDAIFLGGMHDQFNTPLHRHDPSGRYNTPTHAIPGTFSSEIFGDAAVKFLEGQSGDEPFFCYVAFTSPHDPRTPPKPFDTMYRPGGVPLPANFLPEHPFDNGELKIRDEMLAPFPRTPEDTRRQLAEYYGMVSANDFQVGRMIAALEKAGQLENTIVVCTGDHGLAIGSHGLFGKQNMYEPSVGIPMFLSGPGVQKGRTDALVYNLDLYPTLCELAGVPVPQSVEGRSFVPLMGDNVKAFRDVTFHAYGMKGKMQRAVMDGRWKFHKYEVKGTTTRLLFDLQNDPDEMHDLAADAKAAGELERMEKLLAKCQREADDPVVGRG
jgi:arylsulfatase A-like enzyme